MNTDNILTAHLRDLAERALKTGCAISHFIPITDAVNAPKISGVKNIIDGGCENAERVRVVFVNSDWGEYERDNLFGVLEIKWNKNDTLGHRDILGSVMSLGIERKVVGDIIITDDSAIIICLPEMSDYIIENITKIGRVGVTVTKATIADIPDKTVDLSIKRTTVASMRLDVIIGAAFNLSRTKVTGLIEIGRVSINHAECLKSEKIVDAGAIISAKGKGCFKIVNVGDMTRKGRIIVELGLYESVNKK